MLLTLWEAVNFFNNNNYVLDDAQRKVELSVVCALALVLTVCLASLLTLKIKRKKDDSEKK